MANPILPVTALLRPNKTDNYIRAAIYDPTYTHPSYDAYQGQRIIPVPGSIVMDYDTTPLWVISIDPETYVPTYEAIRIGSENDNVVSILNYGNSVLRLYVDYRAAPYPATPDTKCIFIGKSPRFYTLTRYPRTSQATIISQYYNQAGGLVSQMVPLSPMDTTNTSWYLQRGHLNTILDDNEEVLVTIYNEDGVEVYSAQLFVKESAVINEDIVYAPTIVGMSISSNQRLANGDFFLYEKQDFASLGIQVNLVYDDGSSYTVPIDGIKCVMYGQEDFISSFSGLRQPITIKYYRSENEAIDPMISDATGTMISTQAIVTVIPNTLGTTVKIMAMPSYNPTTARYVMRYYMYFADGRTSLDVTGSVSIIEGTLNPTSAYFGQWQTYVIAVDMRNVDPTNYPTSALYQQTIVIQFGIPTATIKYQIRDSSTSTYIYGQDNSTTRRPSIRFDRTRGQAFIPSYVFGNQQAFLRSFYTMANPPYDPTIAEIPQVPTHFLLRDIVTGNMLITAPLPISSFQSAFNLLNDTVGMYIGATICMEFLNVINPQTRRTLFGVPVDMIAGTYNGV
jgi:hypothetical protein